jgi:beta-galactosidase
VDGNGGRLPTYGVGWYRRTLTSDDSDNDKEIYIELDGAMAYGTVWMNGVLVGGWPFGFASWRLNLTPYMRRGDNQLDILLRASATLSVGIRSQVSTAVSGFSR